MEICDKAEVGHQSDKISYSNGDMESLSTAQVLQMTCTVDSFAAVGQQ